MIKIKPFKIKDKFIGDGFPAFIIAEVGQAHDGSLSMAYSFVDAVAKAGVDAIKFQTHYAEEESTLDEKFRIKFSRQDKTRYDYWKRMEFSEKQWSDLSNYSENKGLIFLSSAFSIKAVNILSKINMPAWKIGSGEIENYDLIKSILKTKKPILLSTGMHNFSEIKKVVSYIKKKTSKLSLLQCTSKYPTKLEEVGINVIHEFKKIFKVPSGLSDHSGTIYPTLASMALGSNIIEVHVCFNKDIKGPDTNASISFEELRIIKEARDSFFILQNNPQNKYKISKNDTSMRKLFKRSIALKNNKLKGEIIKKSDLILKKPGTGIPSNKTASVVGKTLVKNVTNRRLLKTNDYI